MQPTPVLHLIVAIDVAALPWARSAPDELRRALARVHPPAALPDGPNAVDPRGYSTFALTGLAVVILARLAGRSPDLPGWVSPLGLVLGVFLVLTFLGRLIVLDATSLLVLGPALVAGLLSPIFFLLLGAWLLGWRRSPRAG